MKTTRLLLLAAASLTLAACGSTPQRPASAQADMHNAENALDYLGTYEGDPAGRRLPGHVTALTLNADGTYDLHMKYIDRETEFDERGAFAVGENLLTLSRPDGGPEKYYKVEENRLRMLDAERNPVSGELAEHYVLQKKR